MKSTSIFWIGAIGLAVGLLSNLMPFSTLGASAATPLGAQEVVDGIIDVEPVWAGHSVGFALLTRAGHQYAAYYDANRQMTVAQRKLQDRSWTFQKLPTQIGWDSHNYVTMAVDATGNLHVSGNMHCVPLIYFRTTTPGDARTLTRIPNMVGPEREQRATYPIFLKGPGGELVFKYRDGRSGRGDEIYNVYDPRSTSWRRLISQPLTTSTDGKGNAYFAGPIPGGDGFYHLAWVWRDTPDCASNHDLSYARSKDLVRWTSSAGKEFTLPITLATAEVVDPTPVGKGLLNSCVALGFDQRHRPVMTYHKYDPKGNSQIYAARLEDGQWRIRQVSQWKDYRWEFSGGGTIVGEISVGRVTPTAEGLTLSARSKVFDGTWLLDDVTLQPKGTVKGKPAPQGLVKVMRVESDFPGVTRRTASDLGQGEPGTRYMMIWETLGANRDRPRDPPLPGPSMLRVVRIRTAGASSGPAASANR
jgi:hypothetical protein